MNLLKSIYISSIESGQTVFSFTDINSIYKDANNQKIKSALKYLVQKKEILRISKGFYALNDRYSIYEYANKLRTPSYVSLYTVLFENGVVFQPYDSIYLMSKRSETKMVNDKKIVYKNIKDVYLLNHLGINAINGVSRASTERAICDTIYMFGIQHFDNLLSVDFDLLRNINKDVYNGNKQILKWISQNTSQI